MGDTDDALEDEPHMLLVCVICRIGRGRCARKVNEISKETLVIGAPAMRQRNGVLMRRESSLN